RARAAGLPCTTLFRSEERRAPGEAGSDDAAAHGDILDSDQGGGSPPPNWLEFIPSGPISHLKRWHFIKGDPDPLPSVPHGYGERSEEHTSELHSRENL